MSEPKRYYWLQLSVDFFNSIEIKLLRKIAGGDTYTIIYLKMLLASLKDEGKMYFEGIAENIYEEVALLIDEDVDNVKVTMMFLEKKRLIEIHESDEYFLNQVPSMIGSETSSASRMRRLRANKKKEELLQSDVEASQCDKDVTEQRNIVHESDDIKNKSISRYKIDNTNTHDSCANDSDLEERFEKIWEQYPNKKGKPKAFISYKKAIKENVTDEEMLKGIESYKKEIKFKNTQKKYIKHGSTWFNNKGWEDEYDYGEVTKFDLNNNPYDKAPSEEDLYYFNKLKDRMDENGRIKY